MKKFVSHGITRYLRVGRRKRMRPLEEDAVLMHI